MARLLIAIGCRTALLSLLGLIMACNSAPSIAVFPVEGKAFYRGAPAVDAQIFFQPVGFTLPGSARPSAVVQADGTYRLSTFKQFDGAPPGEYRVCVTWLSDAIKQDGENVGPDRLQNRYCDPAKSPLQVNVQEGANVLATLELQ